MWYSAEKWQKIYTFFLTSDKLLLDMEGLHIGVEKRNKKEKNIYLYALVAKS